MREFERLVELVARLRGPHGCPWDRAQTHQALKGMLLEEAYEAVAAIESSNPEALQEELGDLLLHVIFHSQIAREAGEFTIFDVISKLNAKLVRRHPHVFGGPRARDAAEVRRRWEEIKQAEEKEGKTARLPALVAARKAQDRLAHSGCGLLQDKRLRLLLGPGSSEEEVGALLYRVVALARELRVEPELALHRFTEKEQGAHAAR